MDTITKKKLSTLTVVYWFLLMYIITALIWWFVSLNQQNNLMGELRISQLKVDDSMYNQKITAIIDAKNRKTAQYIGEGAIFLLVIIIGAIFIFQSTKKQLKLGEQQRNFMMAITHELKTPIAITKLSLETLKKRKLDEAQQKWLIANTLHEVERLNDLCNNILLTSHLESGINRFIKEELELSSLAKGCVTQFKTRFPDRQIDIETAGETAVYGEQLLLQLLVNNLVENALKYSPKEKKVLVVVKPEGEKVLLQVKDEGYGIADVEKRKIFDKYYRIGNAKTRTLKGTGLGLYLCKKIMINHKGELTVSDNKPEGSIFTASFMKHQ